MSLKRQYVTIKTYMDPIIENKTDKSAYKIIFSESHWMNLFSRNVVIHSFHGQMVSFYICIFLLFTSVCPILPLVKSKKRTFIHLLSHVCTYVYKYRKSNKCEKKNLQFFYSITFILWLLFVSLSVCYLSLKQNA